MLNKPITNNSKPKWHNQDSRPQPYKAAIGPSRAFCLSIGATAPKNESQAALLVLDIHKRFLVKDCYRRAKIDTLPTWKKWIIATLNLPI